MIQQEGLAMFGQLGLNPPIITDGGIQHSKGQQGVKQVVIDNCLRDNKEEHCIPLALYPPSG